MARTEGSDDVRKPRRKKGTGSIFPTKEGTYRATIKLTELNGDVTPHSRRFPTAKEAEAYLDDLVARHKGGAFVQTPAQEGMTVLDLMRNFINNKYQEAETSNKLTLKTVYDYDSQIKLWILPKLGTVELKRLHEDNVYEWLAYMNNVKSVKKKGKLSDSRKARVWGVFKAAMRYGVVQGYIKRNPLLGITGFENVETNPRLKAMTESDYQKFTAYIREKGCDHGQGYCYLRWILAVDGTRRQNEVLGLDWAYVHLEEDPPYIQVQSRLRAEKWLHDCGAGVLNTETNKIDYPCGYRYGSNCPKKKGGGLKMIGGTKGGRSNQPIIPIDEFLDDFIDHKIKQQAEIATAKAQRTYNLLSPTHVNLVFTQPKTQRPFQASMDRKRFVKILDEIELSQRYTVHDLRHTAVSRIVEATSNIRLAQEIAGHKTLAVTAKYATPSLESKQSAFTELKAMKERKAREMAQKAKQKFKAESKPKKPKKPKSKKPEL